MAYEWTKITWYFNDNNYDLNYGIAMDLAHLEMHVTVRPTNEPEIGQYAMVIDTRLETWVNRKDYIKEKIEEGKFLSLEAMTFSGKV